MSGRPRVEVEADRIAGELLRAVAGELRRICDDAGIAQASLAADARVSVATVSRVLGAQQEPSLRVLSRMAVALGADVALHVVPGAGIPIHDRYQARMMETFLREVHPVWTPFPEVAVRTPSRGSIDLVLADAAGSTVAAVEFQSQIRRAEQTIRWSREKADALRSTELYRMAATANGRPPSVPRILVLRSTAATRMVVRELEALFRAAYPASARDTVAALRSGAPLPGDALVWMHVRGRVARLMDRPPREVGPSD